MSKYHMDVSSYMCNWSGGIWLVSLSSEENEQNKMACLVLWTTVAPVSCSFAITQTMKLWIWVKALKLVLHFEMTYRVWKNPKSQACPFGQGPWKYLLATEGELHVMLFLVYCLSGYDLLGPFLIGQEATKITCSAGMCNCARWLNQSIF